MALLIKRTERLHHPTEPDTWFDVRVPMTVADAMALPDTVNTERLARLHLVANTLEGWSYDAQPTPETVSSLDMATFGFLYSEINRLSGMKGEFEKKDSETGSSEPSPTPSPSLVS